MTVLILTLTCQLFGAPPTRCNVEFRTGLAPVVIVTEVPVFSNSFEG